MPSLTQLLSAHYSLLVLDAASTRVQVGLLRLGEPAIWRETREEAGTGIFTLVGETLAEAGLKIPDIGAFLFCEGPGSMLGVRTVAMALRTWQALSPRPAYSYQSLALAARYEWRQKTPRTFAVIADARRDAWHCSIVSEAGAPGKLARLPASALPAHELVTPENFRAWTPLPEAVRPCSYQLSDIFPIIAEQDYFHLSENPDAFQHEAPAYKKWSAQIHSSATAPQK